MGLFSRKKKKQPVPPAQTADVTLLICTNNRNTLESLMPVVLDRRNLAPKPALSRSAEILEQYQADRPDLVMIDNDLDGQSGLEVLRALHEAGPGAVIVFLAAFYESSAQEMLAKALAYGANQILAKDREGNVPADNVGSCLDKVLAAVAEKKAAEL